MKYEFYCLTQSVNSFYKKFNLQKGSKTENMKAKLDYFYITEDHEDRTKKTARCNVAFFFFFFVGAENERLKAHHLKYCGYTAMFCNTSLCF